MSGFSIFSDPLPIRTRLYELSPDETDAFRRLYKRFGRNKFTTSEFYEVCAEVGTTVRRMSGIKYIRRVGKSLPKKPKYWEICPEYACRFEEEEMIHFEPYKMEYPPYSRYKIGKWKIVKLGMTLDRNWYYCLVNDMPEYSFVMCRASHMARKLRVCPIYKVDFARCFEWLNTQKSE